MSETQNKICLHTIYNKKELSLGVSEIESCPFFFKERMNLAVLEENVSDFYEVKLS